ncbi:MAG: hypothetical protein V7636_1863, partial [Actinomycetota bacterium]
VTLKQSASIVESSRSVTRVSGNTYDFGFTGADFTDFATGAVAIDLGAWSDSAGGTAAASSLGSFTLGEIDAPRASLVSTGDGAVIAMPTAAGLTVDVDFVPASGQTLGAIGAGLVTLAQGGVSRAASSVALVVGGSGNRYRFSFTGRDFSFLQPGAASVVVAGGWAIGAVATQADLTIAAVTTPHAVFVDPATGAVIDSPTGSFAVVVEFVPAAGATLDPADNLVTLAQGTATATSNLATHISGTRWSFTFATITGFHPGAVTITVDGSWATGAADLVGNATIAAVTSPTAVLVTPAAGASLGTAPSGSAFTVDVDLIPVAGATVSVPVGLITLTQGAATATSTGFTVSGSRYHFSFTGVSGFGNGDVAVTIAGGWTTGAAAVTKTVTVTDATHPLPAARLSFVTPADGSVIATPTATFTVTIDVLDPAATATLAASNVQLKQGTSTVTAHGFSLSGTRYTFEFTTRDFSGFHAGAAQVVVSGSLASTANLTFIAVSSPQAAIVTPADGSVIATPTSALTIVVDFAQAEGTALTAPTAGMVKLSQGGTDVFASGVTAGTGGRYTFDFASRSFAGFHAGIATITVTGWATSTVTIRSVTSAQAEIVTPADGAVISTPTDAFTVTLALAQIEGSALTAPLGTIVHVTQGSLHADSNAVTSPSTGRYVFDFAAGAFAGFGAGDIAITIDGYTTTATVTARRVTTPTTLLVAPIDTVGYASRTSLTVDVRFVPTEGASISAPAATLIQLKQGSTVIATSTDRSLVSGSTYRFSFSAAALANLVLGTPITVALATGWSDSASAPAATGALGTIRMDVPDAVLDAPANGTVVGAAQLAALGVDVQFHAVDGQSIETGDIAAGLVTLYQASNGFSVAAGRVTRVGNTFHFDQ